MKRSVCLLALVGVAFWAPRSFAQDNVNDAFEKATKEAVKKLAPTVVKIETSGGTEVIRTGPRGQVRKGVGPTTGVIVAPDGYIISSAFNFANKPSAIFVTIPGHGRKVAEEVATDKTRMLTLLKVDAKDLPIPEAMPKDEIRVGHWSLALGRTLSPEIDDPPSVSVGIISALDRVWGKAIQTDAKVSPVNYGGPLVSIDGRVQGIIVPASPQSEGETAGVEWYDSGIGFAIPLEDIFRVLPKLKQGTDLEGGVLGIAPKSNDMYSVEPEIGRVSKDSAAEKAGLKVGDVIVAIDGEKVYNQAQVLHAVRPKYAGDTISVVVKRGDKELTFENIQLTGSLQANATPFLGILPMRDDPDAGLEVRYVFPKSPAEKAGIKVGDRLMKIAPSAAPRLTPFAGRDQFLNLLNRLSYGTEVKIELKRKEGGKTETVTLALDAMTNEVPDAVPLPSSQKKALEEPKPVGPMRPMGGPRIVPKEGKPDEEKPDEEQPEEEQPKEEKPKEEKPDDEKADEKEKEKAKVETGLIERTTPALKRDYWLYVPENYDPNVSHGLIVWLHPAGRENANPNDMIDIWEKFCWDHHFILLGPKSSNEEGWLASEMDFVLQHIKEARDDYTIDAQRIVAHGMGVGGQMAFYLAFNARDVIRGVATTGAVLRREPKENNPSERLQFFIVAGDKDPLFKDIAEAKPKLEENKFPVYFREIKDFGKEYLDVPTFELLARWMDALDRL